MHAAAEGLIHTSNLYRTAPGERLAAALVARSFASKVFFCNSGAEANEGAFKFARRWARTQGEAKHEIIALRGAFHGRLFGTLAATDRPSVPAAVPSARARHLDLRARPQGAGRRAQRGHRRGADRRADAGRGRRARARPRLPARAARASRRRATSRSSSTRSSAASDAPERCSPTSRRASSRTW